MGEFFNISFSTYAIVIGWINVIVAVITLIVLRMAFDYFDEILDILLHYFEDSTGGSDILAVVLYIILICTIVIGITSALLIYGTKKRRYEFMIPWLIVWTLILCLLVFATGFSIFGMLFLNTSFSFIDLFFTILATIMYYPVYKLCNEIYAARPPEPTEDNSTTL